MSAGPIRVLLADDQTLVRAGFRSLLDRAPDIEVVAEAADGAAALAQLRSRRVDVALMDIRMPTMDGLAATRQIAGDPQLRHVRVIILTTFDIDEYVFEALQLGASGFLAKDVEPDELRRAVRVVAAGEALLSPGVTRRVIAELATRGGRPGAHAERLATLTEREREVVSLVATGLDNRDRAAAVHEPAHRQDARQPGHHQAGRAGPGAAGGAGVRERPGRSGWGPAPFPPTTPRPGTPGTPGGVVRGPPGYAQRATGAHRRDDAATTGPPVPSPP